jgi:hypothetical protein
MLKLGLVEVTTQTIGSILKGNAFTYVAGGAVQGVSAAYLTRLAGLSLIEYFQEQEVSEATGQGFNLERLGTEAAIGVPTKSENSIFAGFVKQGGRASDTEAPQPHLRVLRRRQRLFNLECFCRVRRGAPYVFPAFCPDLV